MTQREFSEMLNEYLTYDLLKEELEKRDFLISKVEKDNGWTGGRLPIPFKASSASSIRYGKLTNENDINSSKLIRGYVDEAGEIWGSLIFHERDLQEHNGKVSEKSFINNLTSEIDDMINTMRESLSINLLSGDSLTTIIKNSTAKARIYVNHPQRLDLNQIITLSDKDNPNTTLDVIVDGININSGAIDLRATPSHQGELQVPENMNKQGARVYSYSSNTNDNKFVSVRSQIFTASNGGSDTIFSKQKSSAPFLQSIEIDGSDITSANILEKIFDAFVRIKTIGKGNPNECCLSFKHMGNIAKILEDKSGPYRNVGSKVNPYGFETVTVSGVKGGMLDITAVNEMPDDIIYFLDWRNIKLHSNNMFQIRESPEKNKYHVIRTEDGYKYVVDICLSGQVVISKPSHQGGIYGIPN